MQLEKMFVDAYVRCNTTLMLFFFFIPDPFGRPPTFIFAPSRVKLTAICIGWIPNAGLSFTYCLEIGSHFKNCLSV